MEYWKTVRTDRKSDDPNNSNRIDEEVNKRLAPEIQDEFPVWRLITERVATLKELSTIYSYEDIVKMNAVLDMRNFIDEKQAENVKTKGNK